MLSSEISAPSYDKMSLHRTKLRTIALDFLALACTVLLLSRFDVKWTSSVWGVVLFVACFGGLEKFLNLTADLLLAIPRKTDRQ